MPTIFFPILKQCKQVTYAFKTPLPLPHPPKSLSSYFLGETSLRFCNCFCARGLQAAEKWLGLVTGGGPNGPPLLPYSALWAVPCFPPLASSSHQKEGRPSSPSCRSLGLLPSRVYISFLPGSYVTSYRVVVIHRLIC